MRKAPISVELTVSYTLPVAMLLSAEAGCGGSRWTLQGRNDGVEASKKQLSGKRVRRTDTASPRRTLAVRDEAAHTQVLAFSAALPHHFTVDVPSMRYSIYFWACQQSIGLFRAVHWIPSKPDNSKPCPEF